MDYTTFSVNDFLIDPYFLQWVAGADEETNLHWETWMRQHPDKAETLREAAHLARLLVFRQHALPAGRAEEMLEKIHARLEAPVIPIGRAVSQKEDRRPQTGWFAYGQRVAAIVVGTVLLVALLLYLLPGRSLSGEQTQVRYTTAFGETRTIVLPDRSTAVLNANSSLTLAPDWEQSGQREVWVKGEAFFSVVHTPDHQRFIVHADSLEVEVLGTKFSVDNRRGGGAVVLSEGKVQVRDVRQTQQLVMAPGERVAFTGRQNSLTSQKVNPAHYTAWRHRQLAFEATPLREVAQRLQDTYGLNVVFTDSSLHARTFTGTIPSDDLEGLLHSLAVTFNQDLHREADRAVFRPRP